MARPIRREIHAALLSSSTLIKAIGILSATIHRYFLFAIHCNFLHLYIHKNAIQLHIARSILLCLLILCLQVLLQDPDAFWDFLTLRKESTHQVMFLFSDRGTPDGYRHMNGYGSHTYKLVNKDGAAVWCKFHFKVLCLCFEILCKNISLARRRRKESAGGSCAPIERRRP